MQDFAETPAVVLAGGLGMRLRAVVKDRRWDDPQFNIWWSVKALMLSIRDEGQKDQSR